MKIKTNIPNTLFFFDFPTLEKQIKINSFSSKTLLKLVAKKLKKMGIFALEILVKNNSREGIYIADQSLILHIH